MFLLNRPRFVGWLAILRICLVDDAEETLEGWATCVPRSFVPFEHEHPRCYYERSKENRFIPKKKRPD